MNQFALIMHHLGLRDVYASDRIFKAFDEDNSGGISALELLFGLAASLDCSVVNKVVALCQSGNGSTDGRLDREQLTDMLMASKKFDGIDHVERLMDQIFQKINGFCSVTSISQDMLVHGMVKYPEVMQIFDRAFGTPNSGLVNESERKHLNSQLNKSGRTNPELELS